MSRATVLKPGEGKTFWVLGDRVTGKIGSAQTGGAFALSEITAAPGGGPPPHLHTREDEMFYVLDGQFSFLFADKLFHGSAGSCVYLPKGIPHTFKNVGDRPGTFLAFAAPCGFERFIAAVGSPTEPVSREIDPADVQKLLSPAPKFGIDMNPAMSGPPKDAGTCPDGQCRSLFGVLVTIKLGSADTGGKFTVAEVKTWPGGGPPPHSHREQDELFYVLEGSYEFLLGDRAETHGPGTTVFVPHGVMHTFRSVGTSPARLFDLHTPGGFEDFFLEAGVPATDRTAQPPMPLEPPDSGAIAEFFSRHGMDM